ncbi:MAG TPA: Bax inhibitor-1/YccA family protein [Gemmatimonadaceae bacterium]|nr:Bax inhibitor-1/YccA family protein [Gemmatimonadaceae bacterium]
MAFSNPAFSESAIARARAEGGTGVMTVAGAAWKSFALVLLAAASAGYTWYQILQVPDRDITAAIFGGAIAALVVAIVTTFKPNLARITAPIYAVLEGIALGGISYIYEAQFKGIPLIAVGLTFGVALAMLVLYATRIIKVTDRLRSVIIGATVGIFFFYLITLVLGFFHIQMPGVFGFGWAGLLFSSAVVIVAAMNLLLNFDTIERNAGSAPQQMEWYAAFGMLVTLVWLYLELLRWASIVFGGRRR